MSNLFVSIVEFCSRALRLVCVVSVPHVVRSSTRVPIEARRVGASALVYLRGSNLFLAEQHNNSGIPMGLDTAHAALLKSLPSFSVRVLLPNAREGCPSIQGIATWIWSEERDVPSWFETPSCEVSLGASGCRNPAALLYQVWLTWVHDGIAASRPRWP